ncbi:MAG: HIT family protein [Patescibacteria group bacterium]|nr:HIT family protein [Patescibacteria group bacterium]
MGEKCLACRIDAGEVVVPGGEIYSDDHWVVEHGVVSTAPVALVSLKGHMAVRCRRHVEHFYLLTDEELLNLGLLLHDVAEAVARATRPEHVYVFLSGEVMGHVCWHVLPRYVGMPANQADVLNGLFRLKTWVCSHDEASKTSGEIKGFLDQLVAARGNNELYAHMGWR